jgi:photosystem II stability/assembly factor-like uncharacterized protein
MSARYFVTAVSAALSAALAMSAGSAQALSFTPVAAQPESPVIRQLVAIDGEHLIAVAAGGQMFESLDGGVRWSRFGAALGRQVTELAYGGGVYYANTFTSSAIADSGIFASDDGGASWRAFNTGLPTEFGTYNLGIGNLVADAQYVYVGANANSSQGIYRSAHGASASWSLVHGLGNGRDAVLVRTATSLCLWSPQDYRFGVEYSLDSGATWIKGSGFGYPAPGDFSNNAAPTAIAGTALSADGTRLYANNVGNARLYRSDDGCKTFSSSAPSSFSNVDPPRALGVSLAGVLYVAGTSGKLLSSADAGASFGDASGVDYQAQSGRSITQFVRSGEGILFGTSGDGLFGVTRGGFRRANGGLAVSSISALGFDAAGLIALVSGSGLHRLSVDIAQRPANAALDLGSGRSLTVDGDAIVVNATNSLYRSDDGGASWNRADSGIADIQYNPAFGPAIVNSDWFVGVAGKLYRSTDRGSSWSATSATLPANERIASLTAVGGTLLAIVNEFSTPKAVYRSTDGGATLNVANNGISLSASSFDTRLNRLVTLPSGVYVQTTNSALYRTSDAGASWTAFTTSGLPTASFAITSMTEDANGTLYLSYAGPDGADVYYKGANATGWTRDRSGLPRTTPRSSWGTAMVADGNGLRIAVQDAGLYRSDLAPATPPPAAPDTVPDAFTFADQNEVATNTLVTSNEVTISGIDSPTAVSIGDVGEYSINGGAYTRAAGTLVNGARLRVRHSSSANGGQAVVSVVTVGGIEGRFTSRTAQAPAPDTTPDAFDFADVVDALPDTDVHSQPQTISGIDAATAIRCSGCSYSVNGVAFTSADGSVRNGDVVTLSLRSSTQYSTTVNSSVTIGGVSDAYSVRTRQQPDVPPPADTTPDAFSFPEQTEVEPGSLVTSAAIIVAGIDAPAGLSIDNGEYSINGGDFTRANGSVANGDSLRVRHTAASGNGVRTLTTLGIGGVNGSFASTTRAATPPAADGTPDAFSFASIRNAPANTPVSSQSIVVSGINVAAPISVSGGEYRIGDGAFTGAAGEVRNGDRVSLRLQSAAAGQSKTATLSIGGVSANFTVTSADAAPPTDDRSAVVSDANGRAVSISTNAGRLVNAGAVSLPSEVEPPADQIFANGAFSFAIEGLAAGATVQVAIKLPSGTRPQHYYKYGPEAGNATPHWYLFDAASGPGAQIVGDTVILTLVDNGRGDSDPTPGRIADPGAPSRDQPIRSGGAFGLWSLLLLVPALLSRRRHASMR